MNQTCSNWRNFMETLKFTIGSRWYRGNEIIIVTGFCEITYRLSYTKPNEPVRGYMGEFQWEQLVPA